MRTSWTPDRADVLEGALELQTAAQSAIELSHRLDAQGSLSIRARPRDACVRFGGDLASTQDGRTTSERTRRRSTGLTKGDGLPRRVRRAHACKRPGSRSKPLSTPVAAASGCRDSLDFRLPSSLRPRRPSEGALRACRLAGAARAPVTDHRARCCETAQRARRSLRCTPAPTTEPARAWAPSR